MTNEFVPYTGDAKAVKSAQSFHQKIKAGHVTGDPTGLAMTAQSPILLYPSDIGSNPHESNYILFTGYSIANATLKPIISPTKTRRIVDAGEYSHTFNITKKEEEAFKHAAAEKSGQTGRSLTLSRRNVPKSGTVIGLYMPPAVNVSYSMDYERAPIGFMGEAIAGVIQDIQRGTSMIDAVSNSAGALGTGALQKGIGIVDKVIPGAKDLIALERGVIITPRTELMFRGIGPRSFSFTFTFIPKDNPESKIIHQIVQKFKEGMTPSFTSGTTTREMTIPDVFQIDYMSIQGQNNYLNKIGKCYLEKMDVTYGGDKFVTYDIDDIGTPPQKTVITLSFKELEIIDKSMVKAGF